MKKIVTMIVFAAMALTQTAMAQLRYQENVDYRVLDNPLTLTQQGQKEVLEFFSYSCPHCYNLEAHILKWAEEKKSPEVLFKQIPALGGSWDFVGRVKFVADKLNLGHAFDTAYFKAIHKQRNRRLLGDKDSAIDFIVEHGKVDKATVEKAWDSLHVKSEMKKAIRLWNQTGLDGVPAVVVNGKYVVRLTADYRRFFDIIDFLLETTMVPQS